MPDRPSLRPHDAIADARRGRLALLGLALLYAAGVVALAASDRFAFFPKELLLPILLLPPALSGQLREFMRDWAVFLAGIVLFDALRGLIFALTARSAWPVYMMYAIDAERSVFGGEVLPVVLQSALFDGVGTLEKGLAVVHASHFAAFFVFGGVIWHWRRSEFSRYANALLLVCYAGLIGYLLVPTVPPWMAASSFGVIPPISRVIAETYNTAIPNLAAAFDTNPIAAMPSLHCAIPTLMSLFAVRLFGVRGLPVVAYTLLVYFTVTYSGEHYGVDVFAGIALAIACYAVMALPVRARAAAEVADDGATPDPAAIPVLAAPDARFAPHLVASGLLCVLTAVVISWSQAIGTPWSPDPEFARTELLGRSPLAHFVLGRDAFLRGDFSEAAAQLEQLAPRGELSEDQRLLAMSYLELGRDGDAARVLEAPTRPGVDPAQQLYWRAKIAHHYGRIDEARAVELAAILERDPSPSSQELGARLRAGVERRSAVRGDRTVSGP
jgi:hypothetical protein